MDSTEEHDITLRVVVTKRLTGRFTIDRKHRVAKKLKKLLSISNDYTVDVCEVASVKTIRR